nr:phospholipase D-like domain-containing protein [uncultured Holophaga sp.]
MANQGEITQIVDSNGNPLGKASKNPGWGIIDGTPPFKGNELPWASGWKPRAAMPQWGPSFSPMRDGNQVEFFVTGVSYFDHLYQKIATAEKSIFITGWQINFDLMLSHDKTLFQCLLQRLEANRNLRIYVLPWMSPKVGVDTCDFETTLAFLHLNAGSQGHQRVFVLPAIQQSGMTGPLGTAFSHHQKSVVIDNQYAYAGGIDLAYGRKDDGRFSVQAEWRVNRELYNSCIPPIHSVTHQERINHLTRGELLAACSDNWATSGAAWLASAPFPWLAKALDKSGDFVDIARDDYAVLKNKWDNVDLVPAFLHRLQDKVVDESAQEIRLAWSQMPEAMREQVHALIQAGCANSCDAGAAVVAWLNGATLEELPFGYFEKAGGMIEALSLLIVKVLGGAAAKRKSLYGNLAKLPHMAPKGDAVVDPASQPRMPWHDVHCCIQGPSVHDLSMNFIQRWNSIARLYNAGFWEGAGALSREISRKLHLDVSLNVKVQDIPADLLPRETFVQGGVSIQVLRSAPPALLTDIVRAKGSPKSAGVSKGAGKQLKQDNCLKAMLQAIRSSQHFIYIENQFFQSDYGKDITSTEHYSGPLGALLDIQRNPSYQKYARMLDIQGVPVDRILGRIRWSQVDDVLRDKPGGELFWRDLQDVLKNHAAVQATTVLGHGQRHVNNPIAQALVWRIRKAIVEDQRDFHVYLVVPVHPEGTLNTLNIMKQVHLTMQSISLGHDSLVNGVRRAILEKRRLKEKGLKPTDAGAEQVRHELATMALDELAREAGSSWKDHLTLLNLRNWATIGGRPVTEQVYVHSKTFIADDRVAIVGSANINDRSELGDRDSELAVLIHDSREVQVMLDGRHPAKVSACVHELRANLWKKLFGLMGSDKPATGLAGLIDKPAAPATWKAIQAVASQNAQAYERAFWYIPRSITHPKIQAPTGLVKEPPCSIWPTWQYNDLGKQASGGRLLYRMPFEAAFWRKVEVRDEANSWQPSAQARNYGRAPEEAPQGIQGFIIELPIHWTKGEDNDSGQNLTILALHQEAAPREGIQAEGPMLAQTPSTPKETPA